jgi:hypothetical protein
MRVRKARLGAGRYRAVLHAVDAAGNAGQTAVVRFRLR